ncbi:MAG: cupin domain-containing protein [Haloarculaceae archaeon]
MSLDRLPEREPDPGEVLTEELVAEDDVLVKAFYLGPGAAVEPHEHADSTNVFHVFEGTVAVIRGEDEREEDVEAPAVVLNERGVKHGARNDGDEVAVFTASLCPLPS